MSKVLAIMNASILGGAEKSIIAQMNLIIPKHEVSFLIPESDRSIDPRMLKELSQSRCKYELFDFHPWAYQVSRGQRVSIFKTVFGLVKTIYNLKKINLNDYDVVWANGSKVGVLLLFYMTFFSTSFKVLWHFRDYPENKGLFKIIWILLSKISFKNIVFVGNSYSVSDALTSLVPGKYKVQTIYNPIGDVPKESNFQGKTLGVVSMFAPWKGIHQIIIFGKLFSQELEELGIDSIKIYGGEVYQTKGSHKSYGKMLIELRDRLKLDNITFEGIKDTRDIYQEIDVLVHLSTKKEPYGRVLLEAMRARVPVISTGLGGAGELLKDNVTGQTFGAFDYVELFLKVKKIIEDKSFRESSLERAYEFSLKNEELVLEQMDLILSDSF